MIKGFNRITDTLPKLRLVMRVGGLEKDGKTHFALTAPSPIGIQDMDRGLEGVVEKFASKKEIHKKSYRDLPTATQKDHEERWQIFVDDYHLLLKSGVRSILWDTDTEVWEMARMAFFGKLTQIKSHHYTTINGVFRGLIDEAFDADKNLILIARYKKQYVKRSITSDESAWNGKYEAAGFNEIPSIAQVNLRAKLVDDEDGNKIPSIHVVNCRQNMTLNGETFYGDDACFSFVAAMIIDGTAPEDWE